MKFRTIFDGYCAVACLISLAVIVFLLGNTLLNTYYYLSPESAYPPAYKIIESENEFKLPKFEIPEGCPDLLQETDEQRLIRKKKRYDYEIHSLRHQAIHQIRSSLVYLVLLFIVFFVHLSLVRNSNAKNT